MSEANQTGPTGNEEIFHVDVIIIGAGPAGISMAAEAVVAGVSSKKIVVLEKEKEHSWSIRKFYPEEKLVTANYKGRDSICEGVACIPDLSKKETLSYLDKVIEDYKINVYYQHVVWNLKKESNLFHVGAGDKIFVGKVCVIAVGIFGRPNKPDYKIGPELQSRVHFDITSRKYEKESILVVGGGDSASEYAQYLNQSGNSVTLSYRKTNFDRMNFINRHSLEKLVADGAVEAVLGKNIEALNLTAEAGQEKVSVRFKEDDQDTLLFDHVVFALGGSTPSNFLKLVGIEFEGEKPKLTGEFETNIGGLFLIGDLATDKRGGSIISAFNSAHVAMEKGAKKYLKEGHLT